MLCQRGRLASGLLGPAVAILAGSIPAHAQSIALNVGSAPSIVAARGDKITVPIVIDLANAGAAGIAALESSLAWRAGQLVFDSIRVVPALGWSFTTGSTDATDGKIDFGASNTTALPATATLLNAYFTAGGAPGGTRIRALPTWSANAEGQAIQELLLTRGLDVCVAGAGRWGDVNDDASVNIIDAQQIARFSVGLSVFDPSSMENRGDITANHSVDIIDAQQVARFSVGLSSPARTNTIPFTAPTTGSIELSPASVQHMAELTTLDVVATPRDTSQFDLTGCASVTWASSDPSVATVSGDGVVVSRGAGTATITARSVGNPTVVTAMTVIVDPAQPPTLLISPDTVRFSAFKEGANPPVQRVAFGNSGSGDIGAVSIGDITYDGGSGWLPTPTIDVFAGQNVVALQPTTAALGVDVVTAKVELRAKGAKNTPQFIVVVFEVRPNPVARSIEVAAGNAQTGPVDTEIAILPTVLVRDQYGDPFVGKTVRFFVYKGGGTIYADGAPTDSLFIATNASGIVRLPRWRLGKTAGANEVYAAIQEGPQVIIKSVGTPQSPRSILKDAGDGQSAIVSTAVARAPQVMVVDAYGNGVPGVTITFVAQGGGSVTGGTQVTDAKGLASPLSWTLKASAGVNSLLAFSNDLFSIFFGATGTLAPATQVLNSAGDGQTQTVDTPTATRPTVRVLNASGGAVAGVVVTFSVIEGGGTLTGAVATTDVNGYASPTAWRMGTRVGRQSVIADSPGLPSVVFTATASPGAPYSVTPLSWSGGYVTAGERLPEAPLVRVVDQYLNIVPGTAVSFVVTAGDGTVGSATVTTDNNGQASTTWNVGPGNGFNAMQARVAGASSANFYATAFLSIEIVSGTYQSAATGAQVPNMPTVRVRGAYGVVVPAREITWTVTQGGGYWGYQSPFKTRTDPDGLAVVLWWLGPNLGDNVLTASVPGADPVTFTATAKNPCDEANYQQMFVPNPLAGSIGVSDCRASMGILSGVFDGFFINVTTTSMLSFSLYATGFTGLADLRNSNDLARPVTLEPNTRTLMPAGKYYYRAGGLGNNAAGSYIITPSTWSTDVSDCTLSPFIVPGVKTSQSLVKGNDCEMIGKFLFYPYRIYDQFKIYMHAGKTYSFRERSGKFDAYLALYDAAETGIIADDDSAGGTDAYLTYTPKASGVYLIRATSYDGQNTGAYTLEVFVR